VKTIAALLFLILCAIIGGGELVLAAVAVVIGGALAITLLYGVLVLPLWVVAVGLEWAQKHDKAASICIVVGTVIFCLLAVWTTH